LGLHTLDGDSLRRFQFATEERGKIKMNSLCLLVAPLFTTIVTHLDSITREPVSITHVALVRR
jgi:hypothetical protein